MIWLCSGLLVFLVGFLGWALLAGAAKNEERERRCEREKD